MAATVPESTSTESVSGAQLAALDLGSNSFHLIVAQEQADRIQVIDKLKEMIRLADGLDGDNKLSDDAISRGIDCLERVGQRVRNLPATNVRVVGTNTLRRARNAELFIAKAEAALGHKIEVISGYEEARLIYLGVCQSLADNFDQRLVVDIGGGSTELIIGRKFEPQISESLHMGCVSVSKRFFAGNGNNELTKNAFKAALVAAQQELEPVQRKLKESGWDTVIGSSGTILATQTMLAALDSNTRAITLEGLYELRDLMISAGSLDAINLSGLPSNRAPVYPGGLTVLTAVFTELGITEMQVSDGALREGLLHDLVGRVHSHDVREQTVADLIARFHIDERHTRNVRETARALLAQIASAWELTQPDHALLLSWAAELHELGMDISHSQYHKHGEYLLQNLEMSGFSRFNQAELAALVRSHRRKLALDLPIFQDNLPLLRLAVILRIAVILHRSRSTDPLPHVAATATDKSLKLTLPTAWLNKHPLTQLDFAQEADLLSAVPLKLIVEAEAG